MDKQLAIETAKVLKALIELNKISTIIDTFIPIFQNKTIPKQDKVYLHGNFNLGGTVSGRLSSCVAAWTQIKTSRGLVAISELKIGDFVWTHKRRWRQVQDIIIKPVSPMVDIQFCNGYTLTCTTAHKLHLPNGEWKTVQEIISEYIEIVDSESHKYSSSIRSISEQSPLNYYPNSQKSVYYPAQYLPCTGEKFTSSGVSSPKSIEIFDFKRRGSKSNEGQNKGATSQMGGGMFRQSWLFNCNSQWYTSICTQNSYGPNTWIKRITRVFGGTSHRWKSIKQFFRQFSFSNSCRTQKNSFPTNNDLRGKIKAINYRGNLQVWDICVEDDHSYWAEGCFNHNSNPNMQNLPSKGSVYAKAIKMCFSAPEGWLVCSADFNSLEDRISALTTKDKNKLKVYEEGYDGHSLRAYYYFPEQMPIIDPTSVASINSIGEKYSTWRQDSKAPTFALTYGGTYVTLMNNCGFSFKVAKAIEANYHELYKESDEWVQAKLKQASKDGYITAAFGLRVRTPILPQVVFGKQMPYEAQAESRTAGNALGQSWGLLNNRAQNEFLARVAASKHRLDIQPIAAIHDALYWLVRDNPETVKFVNDNLIECMEWQAHPDIAHDKVKLGAELCIHYPTWVDEIAVRNKATIDEITEITSVIKMCQFNRK